MKSIISGLQVLLIFSIACHLFMLLSPAIDAFGFFGTFLYVLLCTTSWVLLLQSKDIKKNTREDKE